MDSGHKNTEVKYTESPKYQCLEFLERIPWSSIWLTAAGKSARPGIRSTGCPSGISSALCYKREGHFYGRRKTTELGAHDAFLIMPEETTVYRADAKEPWSYVWAAFDGIRAYEISWNMPVFLLSREWLI